MRPFSISQTVFTFFFDFAPEVIPAPDSSLRSTLFSHSLLCSTGLSIADPFGTQGAERKALRLAQKSVGFGRRERKLNGREKNKRSAGRSDRECDSRRSRQKPELTPVLLQRPKTFHKAVPSSFEQPSWWNNFSSIETQLAIRE